MVRAGDGFRDVSAMRDVGSKHSATVPRRAGRTGAGLLGTGMAVLVLTGCEVVNPGPVQNSFLNDPQSHQPLVDGAGRMTALSLKGLALQGALPSREVFPTGPSGGCDGLVPGWNPQGQTGHFPDGEACRWDAVQQALFISRNALDRFINQGALPADQHDRSPLIAQAHIWAGYAYRIMGEHFCDVVFEGGSVEPGVRAFERAEAHFTSGLQVATTGNNEPLRRAAQAGRAQARLWLGNWSGAAADASALPSDFVYWAAMDNSVTATRNRIFWASANQPYTVFTVWNTFFADYYEATGDPRTPWRVLAGVPFGGSGFYEYGAIPFTQQRKYTGPSDDIRLASGAEMRLIQAEVLLRSGEWEAAMDLINGVRAAQVSTVTGVALGPWTASSLDEAWRYLKRERSIELWLEGRRFGDLRRWEEQSAPGAVDWPDYDSISVIFASNPRSRCLSIPDTERQSNPNVPQDLPTAHLYAAAGSLPGQGN